MASYRIPLMGTEHEINLPDSWTVRYFGVDRPGLTPDQMRSAFANPIGTPRIRDLARGKRTVALIVDDVTRPFRHAPYIHLVLEELAAAGIVEDDIIIVGGVGSHRPLNGPDFRLKLGDDVIDRIRYMNYSLYEHVVDMGTTKLGTPVKICREVAQADLRIGVAGIIQHGSAGYGGGAKIVLPGISSMETIYSHHYREYKPTRLATPDNEFRLEMEEVARLAKIDVIVNEVINGQLEPVGLFVGDVVEAHRAGCKLADEVYFLKDAPSGVDVAIISSYPMDREFNQSVKALAPGAGITTVRDGGSVLFLSQAVDGAGYHALNYKVGERLAVFKDKATKTLGNRNLIIYSPNVGPCEVYSRLPDKGKFFRDLDQAVAMLVALHEQATVNIFPHGGISLLARV